MKNNKTASNCFYIAAAGVYIAALIFVVTGNSILGNVCLCLGSALLLFSTVLRNKGKKTEDDRNVEK